MELVLEKLAEHHDWKDLLLEIVHQENMDPWNIDISLLVQNYFLVVKKMKQLNLRVSANVVLAASLLLRYKSDNWAIQEKPEEEQLIPIPDELYKETEIPELEPIVRETKRKVTLDELMFAIEDIMKKEQKKAKKRQKVNLGMNEDLLEIVQRSKEDFEEQVNSVFTKLKTKVDTKNMAMFSQMLEDQKTSEAVVDNLIPLLHLANEEKLSIWQEQLFGEIFIHLLKEELDAEKTS